MLSFAYLASCSRPIAVVRQPVMALGDADFGIGAEVELAPQHERRDAGEVGLKRQPLQVEHQVDVLVESLGNPHRTIERRQHGRRAVLSRRSESAARFRGPSST